MSEGYYACEAAELEGIHSIPTCADALDAYVIPIALTRVAKAGIPTPSWYLSNEYFSTPVLLYGINPFARAHAVVRDEAGVDEAARSISRNGKFVMCCQEITLDARIFEVELVMDQSTDERFGAWAATLFGIFHLPLARMRIIEQNGGYSFSAMERHPLKSVSPAGRQILKDRGLIHG